MRDMSIKTNCGFCDDVCCDTHKRTIATLTAEKDKLKAHRDRYAAKCDRLTAELEALQQTR